MVDRQNPGFSRLEVTLQYPEQELTPRDFLRFIQLGSFQDDWARLGLNDDDLVVLEVMIMAAPDEAVPERGTGGFRLIRFVSPHFGLDRANGVRVGYAYFPDSAVVALLVAADLNEPLGLTPKTRAALKADIGFIQERLMKGD